MRASLFAELKTLFWLQGKLTLAMFRSRRAADWFWLLRLGLTLIQMIFTFPMFLLLGVGVAVSLALLSPRAAFEAAVLGNTLMTLLWLMAPGMYSSQLMERFEMSRLFPHPISFRGIVMGSTLMAALNMTGLLTLPILAGEIVGLAWHKPLAAPLVALGALPAFALFALAGRLMDDFFDLVASDRRLRALVLFILTAPFMFMWLGQYYLQYISHNFEQLPAFIDPAFAAQLQQVRGPSDLLETLRLSRFLLWLPPGWVSAGMGMVVADSWGKGLLFLALAFGAVGGLLWLHAGVTRRLMEGAALTVGVERVRTRGLGFTLPGPTAFWALVAKDWRYLWRSPLPRRMLFAAVIVPIAMLLPLSNIPAEVMATEFGAGASVFIGLLIVFLFNMMLNMALTANYFGAIDREGFGTLATSVSDWRQVLLTSNLMMLLFSGGLSILVVTVTAFVSGGLATWPLLVYIALALQVSTTPVYTLAAIWGPYRVELKQGAQNRQGNVWGLLAWLLGTPPVALLVLLPYFLWKPGLWLTVPLSALYSVGLYWLTLKPLATLLQNRQHIILERVTKD